ncbi:MAG: peptide chain release factor N(5)-glutamine methyltransferase [Candidatus Omnitrophica bacterium]|nr:peptide chain release factor N(5)-glutamine methyltransferase [Candidatus Omnitrophota bacterium]
MTETELLFTHVLGLSRLELYQDKELSLDRGSALKIASALKRRIKHEPIQYILGTAHFFGLGFKVDRRCLIPRQETEILVETALKYAAKSPRQKVTSLKILDIGTGSGCIAVCLAKLIPNSEVTAIDISSEALRLAESNARLNNVEQKIAFFQSDLFTEYGLRNTDYDCIISNPPYVASEEIKNLQPETSYEPRIALDGGGDGLDFYRRIIRDAPSFLRQRGFLLFEIGIGQRGKIEKVFQKSKKFEIIEVVKDYNNIERVVVAQRKKDGPRPSNGRVS